MDRNTRIDDPDDGMLPASPTRRRASMAIGCLFALVLLGVLIWFGATHTGTADAPGWFGRGGR
jgi:hypothetical protein